VLVQITSGFSYFKVDGSSSSARSCQAISGMGCLVPQPFATGRNQSYPDFWVVTGDPQYRGT
jgi:hypothetical protein